jgi:hypothetical protein
VAAEISEEYATSIFRLEDFYREIGGSIFRLSRLHVVTSQNTKTPFNTVQDHTDMKRFEEREKTAMK